MEELISQASQLIQQSSDLMSHPVVGLAAKEFVGWLGGKFGKTSAKEKLKKIEDDDYDEKTVAGFEANLEFILEDNEQLQKELAEKIQQLEQLMAKEGINITTKTNTMNVTGDHNISIQDVDSKGNINISM